ncbi:MAG: PTS sugar transporter subunit IIA [Eubacteriales bacterium]|nr:PTS sugar transporter subunit IIA [Eubacteriales bacterium]
MDKFKIEDLLDEGLIFMDVEAPDSETLLHSLSDELHSRGYVKQGYGDAVIRRERIYPTGLPTNIMKVAVPHAIERDYVLEPRVLVATLKNPVAFKEMGDGERDVMVDIVFLLAVCGSNDQLTILQKIVGLFSDTDALSEIRQAENRTSLYQILKKHLSD